MWFVYMIQNQKCELYFGCTNNLKRRLHEHNTNRSFATRGNKWSCVYCEIYVSKTDAFAREHQLKYHGQAKAQLKRRLKTTLQEQS